MSTEIVLVRHGETLWNRESKFQGVSDIELSAKGIEQAQKLAQRLVSQKLDKAYASNLQRAYRTAEIVIAEQEIDSIEKVPALREASFGEWEGLTFDEINEQYDSRLDAWLKDPVEVETPGGESFEDLQQRATEALTEIRSKHEEETVLVAAHGGTIRALLVHLLEMPLSNFWRLQQDNTAVNVVKFYDGDPIVTLLNCTRHLDN
ncbi:alpha-ribazole phosphatase [Fuchsiella alkaliacetigena]|uniref:alpha-ribazole phosphatase n=1 Tax=Fuchsiella alkaliacetigena TaxID=957042 RepID=UPI00200B9332|nr:alpha-ribazole phosphatase [Fuchsiella alkaliacetigena]MCK8825511.1 alpha-ribazole phosphatase [Fuchsiella alkaliacetigena]